jgi:CelD/BcsL family acetyltransferase involved in cellulose biosynthesis
MIQVECVRNVSDWASLKPEWDALSDAAVMRGFDWLTAWWSSNREEHQLQILVAKRGEAVIGILPLALTKHAWMGNTLVFLGSGKVCSDDTGILCTPSDAIPVADAFADYLASAPEACRWDHLNLDGVREDNVAMQRFLETLQTRTGSNLEIKTSPCCWSTNLDGGWTKFEASLSRRIRKIYRQVCRERDAGNSRFELATSPEQALEFLGHIERLHQLRWKQKGIEGCFSDQAFNAFLKSVVQSLWKQDWFPGGDGASNGAGPQQRIQIGMLFIDDQPAAGTIGIGDRESLMYYLTGMNTEFSKVRPGWQVLFAFIQRACELGCKRIDFLRGDEEYKAQVNATSVVQHRYVIASPRWISKVRNAAYRAAANVKHWWSPPSTPVAPVVTCDTSAE